MSTSLHPGRLGLCVSFVLSMTVSGWCDTAAEVAAASSYLKRAEDNLALLDGSIGQLTSPPKGSAAKLSRVRLDQASADLASVGKLVDALAEGAGVAEVKARHAAAVKLRDRLQGILDGGSAPPPAAPDPAARPAVDPAGKPAAGATVKLGYPHADEFKNNLFNLRRVEGETAALTRLRQELSPVADPLSIDHRKTGTAVATIDETRRQAGFVKVGLAKIPANGEGVAEAVQQLAAAEAAIDAADAYFRPLHTRLLALIDPAAYPEFNADLKRLRELAAMYANPEMVFQAQRPQAAEALSQAAAAEAECARIVKAYARLTEQQTEQGKQIEATASHFLSQKQLFFAAAAEQKKLLPAEIRKDLAQADRYATEAVAEQKPMWFTGGIPQCMDAADDKLALYAVIDAAGAPAIAKEVATMKAGLKGRADSLKELIIRENPLPADNYVGADRDAAIAVAKDAWKYQEPDFELLAVRIPATAWSRDTRWTYSNGSWYFVDKSTLQVRLIVADKRNPQQAIDRPINVRKDHQSGDSLSGAPLRSFDETLEPDEYLLRTRIK